MRLLIELMALGLGAILFFAFILGLSYGIWYILVFGIFWAFGPIIFGYTFSSKVVLGCWLLTIVINNMVKMSK